MVGYGMEVYIMEALEGEYYTMQKIFAKDIKFYKGRFMSAQDIVEQSK